MDKEKFWGALVGALDKAAFDPETVGEIVSMVMTALDYATEASS